MNAVLKPFSYHQIFIPKGLLYSCHLDCNFPGCYLPLLMGSIHVQNHEIFLTYFLWGGWVSCVLHHRGVQLVLAYSWARPAVLAAGMGRGGMFLVLLFLYFHSNFSSPTHHPSPPPPLHTPPHPFLSCPLLSLFSLSLGDNTK